jgi:glutathione synthase/RimK-type ligase-like ATP-grasp enzyme
LLGSFTAELERRKLTDLIAAKGCGLKIPETTITNNRNELKLFLDKYGKAITKPIHSHINVDLGSHIYASTGTRLVAASDIEQLDEIFAPVLLQEYLEKDIEIRVFFSGEAYFPMAIFSQGNEKTSIDYRNYDDERPNRNVPFSLPEDILAKLIKFNKQINLNTGSIDLIITKNGDYYFLEINPNGIFDDLSVKCNYFIEESIACQIAKHVKEPI